ncbi:DUF4235 domain-containing protein [Cellulomonas soli]|uniref:DUF4235 domain-containing protein n=1 Tax=Cellulomonas soli TaxID=931535 RepID=A0A512PEB6_9CELL|nr:DUF4235 domain-containing protein [Cellulomonas soli]NYI58950.1 hypothetical protein [Cellulomonas soli]GEP69557.1 hypothetical protein CSO01_22720 [Cellulomonas soli]
MADKPTRPSQSVLTLLIDTAATIAAAWAVQEAVDQAWKAARGHKPPRADDPNDGGLKEALAAAAITGALVAASRVLATRGAVRVAGRVERKRTRHLR